VSPKTTFTYYTRIDGKVKTVKTLFIPVAARGLQQFFLIGGRRISSEDLKVGVD
jgi:hypothetical protein